METKAAPLSTDLHKFSSRLQPPQAKQLDRAAEQGSPLRILPTDTDTALLPGWSLTQGVPHSRVGSLSHELSPSAPPCLAGCVVFGSLYKVFISFQSFRHNFSLLLRLDVILYPCISTDRKQHHLRPPQQSAGGLPFSEPLFTCCWLAADNRSSRVLNRSAAQNNEDKVLWLSLEALCPFGKISSFLSHRADLH